MEPRKSTVKKGSYISSLYSDLEEMVIRYIPLSISRKERSYLDRDPIIKTSPEIEHIKKGYLEYLKDYNTGEFKGHVKIDISDFPPRYETPAPVRAQPEPVSTRQLVYMFEEGNRDMADLLGGKGANLAEMTSLGLPVPPGFTVTTEAFQGYDLALRLSSSLKSQIREAVKKLEQKTGKKFGRPDNPLLLSVRSGAKVSMPGMMETILNLGMNERIVEGLISLTNDPSFVYDTYRRFAKMFGETVMGLDVVTSGGELLIDYVLDRHLNLTDFRDADTRREHIRSLQRELMTYAGSQGSHRASIKFADRPWIYILEEPMEQLYNAIEAVFLSWYMPKAQEYRHIHEISDQLGTAVNVQAMVFGNRGKKSFTGVCFSRDTDTGEKRLDGEVLYGTQGEDVVSGSVTPLSIAELRARSPEAYKELESRVALLERHYKDIQDVEFTGEDGMLYLLQTRSAKRTHLANIVAALGMVEEGLISREDAVQRISEHDLRFILSQPIIKPGQDYSVIGKGEPSTGIAIGKAAFDSMTAKEYAQEGQKVILIKRSTDTDDISGIRASEGVLTAVGGKTSHAAVVARGMNKTCVVGCHELDIEGPYSNRCSFRQGSGRSITIRAGDYITLDGRTGEVIKGRVKTMSPEDNPLVYRLEQLIQPDIKSQVIDISSASDISERHCAGSQLGVFGVSSWFLAGDNLRYVRDYILLNYKFSLADELLPAADEKPLEQVTMDLTGRYKSIFSATDRRVYCSLLREGLGLFIPDEDTTSFYNAMHSYINTLITADVKKQQCRLLLCAQEIRKLPDKKRKHLEQAVLKAQVTAIVTAASQTAALPIINIPNALAVQYGQDDIMGFVSRAVAQAKTELDYSPAFELTTGIETSHAILRPHAYLQDAFAYAKNKGDLK